MNNIKVPDDGIIVDVTQEFIDFARAQERGECAVAIAIRAAGKRAAGGLRYRAPKVDRDTVRFTDTENDIRLVFTTPAVVRKMVDAIDNGKKNVRPLSFSLHYREAVAVLKVKHADPLTYVQQGGRTARAASRAHGQTGRRPVYVAEAK